MEESLDLNMYEMDLRRYDPAIARWVVQDPVIHYSMSPYNAFDNNPVFWSDPSGADAESFIIDLFNRSSSGEKWKFVIPISAAGAASAQKQNYLHCLLYLHGVKSNCIFTANMDKTQSNKVIALRTTRENQRLKYSTTSVFEALRLWRFGTQYMELFLTRCILERAQKRQS